MWIPDQWRRGLIMVALYALAAGVCAADQPFTVKAVMVLASDEPAPIDSRLEKVEFRLRRIFKFEHYSHYGEAEVAMGNSSKASMSLGHGYSLEIATSKWKKGRIRTQVRWLKNDATLVNTSVHLKKNVPTILGGVPHKGGNLIVTLTLE